MSVNLPLPLNDLTFDDVCGLVLLGTLLEADPAVLGLAGVTTERGLGLVTGDIPGVTVIEE